MGANHHPCFFPPKKKFSRPGDLFYPRSQENPHHPSQLKNQPTPSILLLHVPSQGTPFHPCAFTSLPVSSLPPLCAVQTEEPRVCLPCMLTKCIQALPLLQSQCPGSYKGPHIPPPPLWVEFFPWIWCDKRYPPPHSPSFCALFFRFSHPSWWKISRGRDQGWGRGFVRCFVWVPTPV